MPSACSRSRHPRVALAQALAQLLHVLAVAAARQNTGDELGRDRARAAETGGDLQIDERFDPVRPRGDVAAAHRGRQRLGEAADPDDAIEAVERGKARRRLRLEIGEDVVLDDGEVVGRRRAQKPVRGLRRERRAGRVVERGVGDVEARSFAPRAPARSAVISGPTACRAR